MQRILVLVIFAFAFSCTLSRDVTLDQQWNLWKQTNNKRYFDAEEHVRYDLLFSVSIFDV